MDESVKIPLTAVDRIADGDGLQMMKATIPYLPPAMQKAFSVYVKTLEMRNLLSYYEHPLHACDSEPADTEEMLQDIRPYCTDAQRQMLDQACSFFSTLKMYQELQKIS